MITEQWLPIKGYEGIYEVSDFGRVKRCSRIYAGHTKKFGTTIEEKILNGSKDKKGYVQTALGKNGKVKTSKAHRLVAIAFIPNPENKPDVNHLNGITFDNRLENLEWATRSENMLHAYAIGLLVSAKKKVAQIKDGKVLKIWESQHEAGRCLGINSGHISSCCCGRKHFHTAGGFKWELA